jgi:hypothetical protein
LLCQSHRKKPEKVSEMVVNSMAPVAIQVSNRVHRRVVFATIGIILVVILGTISVNSGSNRTISYASSISGVGVGIYWDQACTNRTLSLHWGLINPVSNNILTVYIRNEGNSPASLWLTTSNWTPSAASGYMTLNWNYSGITLSADEVIPMELTLSVSPTVSGITDFSFDTVITTTARALSSI